MRGATVGSASARIDKRLLQVFRTLSRTPSQEAIVADLNAISQPGAIRKDKTHA
jgi:hypothetical protein